MAALAGVGTVTLPNRHADNDSGGYGAVAGSDTASSKQGCRYAVHTRVHNTAWWIHLQNPSNHYIFHDIFHNFLQIWYEIMIWFLSLKRVKILEFSQKFMKNKEFWFKETSLNPFLHEFIYDFVDFFGPVDSYMNSRGKKWIWGTKKRPEKHGTHTSLYKLTYFEFESGWAISCALWARRAAPPCMIRSHYSYVHLHMSLFRLRKFM